MDRSAEHIMLYTRENISVYPTAYTPLSLYVRMSPQGPIIIYIYNSRLHIYLSHPT
jgi:hypothetical protein